MERLPAISGWRWIADALALWRRQPMALSLVFAMYLSTNILLIVVPVVGPLLDLLLNQVLTTAVMLACAKIDAGERAHPRQIFAYFKRPVFMRLVGVGVCYLIVSLIASIAIRWYAGPTVMAAVLKANGDVAMLDQAAQLVLVEGSALGIVIYFFLTLPLWFAAPLIAWQEMGLGKAMFFSFFSTLRAFKAFLLYVTAWVLINLFFISNLSALGLMGIINNAAALALLLPCLLILTIVRYCSYYTSYVQVFGKPQLPPDI